VQHKISNKTVWQILLLSLFLMGAVNVEQDGKERETLLEQQKQLSSRIEMLRQEQDFLLFQKAMYVTDSKYLILNISTKTGQLKYKNRVLKDFHFKRVAGQVNNLTRGMLTLTRKIEGAREKNMLVFEKALVLQGVHAPATGFEAETPRFSLSKKDFKPVYYAVEPGAKVYILL
jgi:hypothetical protein